MAESATLKDLIIGPEHFATTCVMAANGFINPHYIDGRKVVEILFADQSYWSPSGRVKHSNSGRTWVRLVWNRSKAEAAMRATIVVPLSLVSTFDNKEGSNDLLGVKRHLAIMIAESIQAEMVSPAFNFDGVTTRVSDGVPKKGSGATNGATPTAARGFSEPWSASVVLQNVRIVIHAPESTVLKMRQQAGMDTAATNSTRPTRLSLANLRAVLGLV